MLEKTVKKFRGVTFSVQFVMICFKNISLLALIAPFVWLFLWLFVHHMYFSTLALPSKDVRIQATASSSSFKDTTWTQHSPPLRHYSWWSSLHNVSNVKNIVVSLCTKTRFASYKTIVEFRTAITNTRTKLMRTTLSNKHILRNGKKTISKSWIQKHRTLDIKWDE